MTDSVHLTKAELDEALEAAAERGALKVAAIFGYDPKDKDGILRDRLFLRDLRTGSKKVRLGVTIGVVGSAVTALGTLLWLGLQAALDVLK